MLSKARAEPRVSGARSIGPLGKLPYFIIENLITFKRFLITQNLLSLIFSDRFIIITQYLSHITSIVKSYITNSRSPICRILPFFMNGSILVDRLRGAPICTIIVAVGSSDTRVLRHQWKPTAKVTISLLKRANPTCNLRFGVSLWRHELQYFLI